MIVGKKRTRSKLKKFHLYYGGAIGAVLLFAFTILVILSMSGGGVVLLSTPGDISTCQELDAPGTYYLTEDIIENSTDYSNCFNITAEGVILDGNGHSINRTELTGNAAIKISADDVEIRDINITGGYDFGIDINEDGSSYHISDISIHDVIIRNPGINGIRAFQIISSEINSEVYSPVGSGIYINDAEEVELDSTAWHSIQANGMELIDFNNGEIGSGFFNMDNGATAFHSNKKSGIHIENSENNIIYGSFSNNNLVSDSEHSGLTIKDSSNLLIGGDGSIFYEHTGSSIKLIDSENISLPYLLIVPADVSSYGLKVTNSCKGLSLGYLGLLFSSVDICIFTQITHFLFTNFSYGFWTNPLLMLVVNICHYLCQRIRP